MAGKKKNAQPKKSQVSETEIAPAENSEVVDPETTQADVKENQQREPEVVDSEPPVEKPGPKKRGPKPKIVASERGAKAIQYLRSPACKRFIQNGASFRSVVYKCMNAVEEVNRDELSALMMDNRDLVRKADHETFLRKW